MGIIEDEAFRREHKELIATIYGTLREWDKNTTEGKVPEVSGTVSFHERRIRSTASYIKHAIATHDADKLRVIDKFLKNPSVTSAYLVSSAFEALRVVHEEPVYDIMTDEHLQRVRIFQQRFMSSESSARAALPTSRTTNMLALYLTSDRDVSDFIESHLDTLLTLSDERGAGSFSSWKEIIDTMMNGSPSLAEGIL